MRKIIIILILFVSTVGYAQSYRFLYANGPAGMDSVYIKMGTDSLFSGSSSVYTYKNRLPVKSKSWLGYIAAMQSLLDMKANISHTHPASQITGLTDAYSKAQSDAKYKLLSTPAVSFVSAGNAITSGTAFQPRSDGPCQILISTTLGAGVVGLRGTSVVQLCATQNGSYTTIGAGTSLTITVLNVADSKEGASIAVPAGWWVKVNNTAVGVGAVLTSTYSRWDIN